MSKSVFITGATRGLGEALARHFADRGYQLALTARSVDALATLAQQLRGKGAEVVTRSLDVCNHHDISGVMQDCASTLGGLDIVIVNAGVDFVTPAGKGHLDQIRTILDVNLTGAIATTEAAIELFRQQSRGQVVGITSVAAARGMKGQGAYCASKAGFSKYLEALRSETHEEPITVTELAPGFIDTDLNRSMPSRPFLVSAERGTAIMADLIERQVGFRYVPPWPWTPMAQLLKILPVSLLRKM